MRPGGGRLPPGLGLGASQLELEYGGGLGGATSWVDTYGYDDSLTGYEPVFSSREAPVEKYKQEQMAKRTGDWQLGDNLMFERKRKRQRMGTKSN